jgi:hypothetical protein
LDAVSTQILNGILGLGSPQPTFSLHDVPRWGLTLRDVADRFGRRQVCEKSQQCFPDCLPTGAPSGPFPTAESAYLNAIEEITEPLLRT